MDDLQALAQKAKEQLTSQASNKTPEDIYAEFRGVNSDTKPEVPHDTLQNQPSQVNPNPVLKNQLDEEEVENPKLSPYDEPLFPGGPMLTQVESWKKQWEGYQVYATEISDQYFIFRTLNRFEYKQLVALKNTDPLQREEIIIETCILWPENYKWDVMASDRAGIPSTLSQVVMEKSGFTKDYLVQVL